MNGQFSFGDISPSNYFFGVGALIGLLFAFIMPDGEVAFWRVLILWQLQVLCPIAILIGIHLVCAKWPWFTQQVGWRQVIFSGIVGSILFSPFALVIEALVLPESTDGSLVWQLLDELAAIAPPVTLCWYILNLPWLLGGRYVRAQGDQTDEPPKSENPSFYELLSPKIRGRLLALSAELHYVKVLTTNGSELILYALKDLIEELGAEGIQTHRSHWIALDAVERFKRNGREGVVILSDGSEIPVSRRYVKDVAERLNAV